MTFSQHITRIHADAPCASCGDKHLPAHDPTGSVIFPPCTRAAERTEDALYYAILHADGGIHLTSMSTNGAAWAEALRGGKRLREASYLPKAGAYQFFEAPTVAEPKRVDFHPSVIHVWVEETIVGIPQGWAKSE
jgi:hypothetical protein